MVKQPLFLQLVRAAVETSVREVEVADRILQSTSAVRLWVVFQLLEAVVETCTVGVLLRRYRREWRVDLPEVNAVLVERVICTTSKVISR